MTDDERPTPIPQQHDGSEKPAASSRPAANTHDPSASRCQPVRPRRHRAATGGPARCRPRTARRCAATRRRDGSPASWTSVSSRRRDREASAAPCGGERPMRQHDHRRNSIGRRCERRVDRLVEAAFITASMRPRPRAERAPRVPPAKGAQGRRHSARPRRRRRSAASQPSTRRARREHRERRSEVVEDALKTKYRCGGARVAW